MELLAQIKTVSETQLEANTYPTEGELGGLNCAAAKSWEFWVQPDANCKQPGAGSAKRLDLRGL